MRVMRARLCGSGLSTNSSFPRTMKYSTPRSALIGEKSASVSRWTIAATSSRYFSAAPSMRVSFPVQ